MEEWLETGLVWSGLHSTRQVVWERQVVNQATAEVEAEVVSLQLFCQSGGDVRDTENWIVD